MATYRPTDPEEVNVFDKVVMPVDARPLNVCGGYGAAVIFGEDGEYRVSVYGKRVTVTRSDDV